MALANLDIQILPSLEGGTEKEKYRVIDAVIGYIQETGLKYEVGALGTVVEGEFEELLEILKKSQEICFTEGADRVCTMAKFDHKKEGITIDEKVAKFRK
ncbi:thiamine-binding protein [uncultured Ilyobacter sp.]|uniref:thiamine-binding protein n=1 Tax=uncultured Ilyobacter sp. TaxID=544433 RepID=UPI0029C08B34|nr:thiamine-binding protein [uncultured Ilyobacter sp.]